MLKLFVRFFSMILAFLTLLSCREKVNWQFPEFEPTPTINSIIVNGSRIAVHVSYAEKFAASPLTLVEDATVNLFINNLYAETLTYQGNGYYFSNQIAEPDVEYKCEVTVPTFPLISCTTIIPKPQNIIRVEHINKAGVNEEGATYPAVKVTIGNNSNENLYFELLIKLVKGDYIRRAEIVNIIDPVLLHEGLPLTIFSNELIVDNSYEMTVNYTTGSYGCSPQTGCQTKLYPFIVELRTVNFDYYQFVKQLYLYELGRYPSIIGGVVSAFPLYSNIENGFGIFAGYSSVETDTIYPSN